MFNTNAQEKLYGYYDIVDGEKVVMIVPEGDYTPGAYYADSDNPKWFENLHGLKFMANAVYSMGTDDDKFVGGEFGAIYRFFRYKTETKTLEDGRQVVVTDPAHRHWLSGFNVGATIRYGQRSTYGYDYQSISALGRLGYELPILKLGSKDRGEENPLWNQNKWYEKQGVTFGLGVLYGYTKITNYSRYEDEGIFAESNTPEYGGYAQINVRLAKNSGKWANESRLFGRVELTQYNRTLLNTGGGVDEIGKKYKGTNITICVGFIF